MAREMTCRLYIATWDELLRPSTEQEQGTKITWSNDPATVGREFLFPCLHYNEHR